MRVLLVHSAYDHSVPSGETEFVHQLERALAAHDLEVFLHQVEVNEWSLSRKLLVFLQVVSGRIGIRSLLKEVDRFQPDIVHFHNIFPQISPLVLKYLHRRGIRTVMTLQNYRLGCLNGLFFRKGDICERCVAKRLSLPGVIRGCYRGSVPGSAAIAIHRARLLRNAGHVTRFLAVSELVAEKAVAAGVREDLVRVTRNFPANHDLPADRRAARENPLKLLFAARLTEEKGTRLLLDALTLIPYTNLQLVVAGSGSLEAEVEECSRRDSRIEFRGRIPSIAVAQLIGESDLVLVPSLWFEADPLIIHQALSRGVPPVVLQRTAAARTLRATPALVSGRSSASLAQTIVNFSENRRLLRDVTERAVKEYQASFVPIFDQIVGHYEELLKSQ